MINISALEDSIKLSEAMVMNLRPGVEKKILWAGKPSVRSKISIVFIHGFSATRSELSPVIENIAKAIKANIFFTRLTGHGQDGKALADASFTDWTDDAYKAVAIGNIIGDKTILIGSSTGCSLIHTILSDSDNIMGAIYVSPNFAIKSSRGKFLRIPCTELLLPFIFGKEISFSSVNSDHKRCWTLSYPPRALLAIKEVVLSVNKVDHSKIKIPILFWFSDDDKIVSAKATRKIIAKIGSNATVYNPTLNSGDDPSKHGILGDILSPSQTNNGVKRILEWTQENN